VSTKLFIFTIVIVIILAIVIAIFSEDLGEALFYTAGIISGASIVGAFLWVLYTILTSIFG
jgi:hypothetical protein